METHRLALGFLFDDRHRYTPGTFLFGLMEFRAMYIFTRRIYDLALLGRITIRGDGWGTQSGEV